MSRECCLKGCGVVLSNGYGFSGVCRETQDSCRGGVSGRTVVSCVWQRREYNVRVGCDGVGTFIDAAALATGLSTACVTFASTVTSAVMASECLLLQRRWQRGCRRLVAAVAAAFVLEALLLVYSVGCFFWCVVDDARYFFGWYSAKAWVVVVRCRISYLTWEFIRYVHGMTELNFWCTKIWHLRSYDGFALDMVQTLCMCESVYVD